MSCDIHEVEWFGLLGDILDAYDPKFELRSPQSVGRALDALLRHDKGSAATNNHKLRQLVVITYLAGDFKGFLGKEELIGRMHELGIEVN